jgi:hypothetical protein
MSISKVELDGMFITVNKVDGGYKLWVDNEVNISTDPHYTLFDGQWKKVSLFDTNTDDDCTLFIPDLPKE